MIQVKNALILDDRLYLLSQIFPKQKNVIIKDLNILKTWTSCQLILPSNVYHRSTVG